MMMQTLVFFSESSYSTQDEAALFSGAGQIWQRYLNTQSACQGPRVPASTETRAQMIFSWYAPNKHFSLWQKLFVFVVLNVR